MAARSRYAEDRLAEAVANGVAQYVVLGAGLDTFAYRNPFPALRVFEVDFPATQEWKRAMLAEAGIALPASLTFVPLDFEHKTLAAGLADAGFDAGSAAFFGWLGVVPYLTLDAFRATLDAIAQLPAGTGVSFDYAFTPETLSPQRPHGIRQRWPDAWPPPGSLSGSSSRRRRWSGNLRRAGFRRIEQVDSERLNELYFLGRSDGLKLSARGPGHVGNRLGVVAAAGHGCAIR